MSRVAVLCPSRFRWHELKAAYESVKATSRADFLIYLDEGASVPDVGPRMPVMADFDGAFITVGPQIGAAQSLNALVVEDAGKHDTYAMMTDDSVMTVGGWDEYVVEVLDSMPGRIGVVSPWMVGDYDNNVDMPVLSREWIDAIGYFAHPEMKHFGWPSVIEELSEGICLVRAPMDRFAIKHTQVSSSIDPRGVFAKYYERDGAEFYRWYGLYRHHYRHELKQKIQGVAVG